MLSNQHIDMLMRLNSSEVNFIGKWVTKLLELVFMQMCEPLV